jgi:hypothetical protein
MNTLLVVLTVLLGILFVVAVALTPVWMLLYQKYVGERGLQELARRLQGHLYGGTCTRLSNLVYENQGQRYHLKLTASSENNTEKILNLSAPWPGQHTRITVFPESFWTGANKFMGLEDHQIGNPVFDSTFVLQSASFEELVDLFQPNTQQLLLQLHAMSPRLNFTVQGSIIQLSVPADPANVDELSQFVATFYNLRSGMLQNVFSKMTHAQQVTAEQELKVVSLKQMDATCMVCGSEVADYRVECKQCGTPHHKDCWGYFGGCSRYGCGGTVFINAKS